jgi:hypothetical protein
MDPRWYGEVKALEGADQDHKPDQAKKKLKLLKKKYATGAGGKLLVRSGRAGKPDKTEGGYWPVWKYKVTIWESDGSGKPTDRKPKCGTDPGVCVRGAGGACESY